MKTGTILTYTALWIFLITLQACGGGSGGGSANVSPTPTNNQNLDQNQNEQENQSEVPNPLSEASCDQDVLPEISGEQNYVVHNITASYYKEESGVTELVSSETVDRVYNAYTWDEFLDIPGEDFLGIWEGEIEVLDEQVNIFISMHSHYSLSGFYLNNNLMKGGSNCKTTIPLSLPQGTHTFKAVYHSNYFSTGFTLNFTDQSAISFNSASEEIQRLSTPYSQVFMVNGYEASTSNGFITVTMPETVNDIVLVLSSYQPVAWKIENLYGATITSVLVSTGNNFSEVHSESDVPIYVVDDFEYESSSQHILAIEQAELLTGIPVSYYNYEYNLDNLTVSPANNYLDSYIIGRDVTILDNYVVIAEEIQSAESHQAKQQLATYFPLYNQSVITNLEWTGSLAVNYPDSTNNSVTLRPHPFVIQIYSGSILPSVLIDEISVDVYAEERYELGERVVNRFTLEGEPLFDLPAGNYWISIQEEIGANVDFYWILDAVIDDGDPGAGGAFRSAPDGIWTSTSSALSARTAPAGNLLIQGIEKYL